MHTKREVIIEKKTIFHDHKRSLEKHPNDEQKCQMIRLFLSNDNHL